MAQILVRVLKAHDTYRRGAVYTRVLDDTEEGTRTAHLIVAGYLQRIDLPTEIPFPLPAATNLAVTGPVTVVGPVTPKLFPVANPRRIRGEGKHQPD